jgi:hypothetical protein
MAYDAVDQEVLLFGGIGASGTDLGDTWTFAGGSWTERILPTGPGARAFSEAAWDYGPGENVTLLYGGISSTSTVLGDLWKFVGNQWINYTPTVGAPPPRWGAVFAFSPQSNTTLLFGGCAEATNPTFPVLMECTDILSDSWRFSHDSWGSIQALQIYGVPPGVVEPEFSEDISPGYKYMYPVPLLVIQSGLVNVSGHPLLNQRWQFSGAFSPWSPIVYPTARGGAEAQYETVDDKIVLFGGYGPLPGGGVGYLNDTWEWDTYEWYPVAHPLNSPSPRAWGALAYDPDPKNDSGQVVYFGGYGPGGYSDQTWAFLGGPATGSWHLVHTARSPPAMANESLAYFDPGKYLVLFGGQNGSVVYNQTWTYSGWHTPAGNFTGAWTLIHPAFSPLPRAAAAMMFSTIDSTIVLFGGYVPTPSGPQLLGDTWTFAGGQWTELFPATSPSPRYGAAFVDDHWDAKVSKKYVSPNGSLPDTSAVLFGGTTGGDRFLNDTWVYFNETWTNLSALSLSPWTVGTPSPAPAAFAAVGDDETDGNVEMFGGWNGNAMADFWTFF